MGLGFVCRALARWQFRGATELYVVYICSCANSAASAIALVASHLRATSAGRSEMAGIDYATAERAIVAAVRLVPYLRP
jgi:hypothetical protein